MNKRKTREGNRLAASAMSARWPCCGNNQRTEFCPSCGSRRPVESPRARALALAMEFERTAFGHRKKADTYEAKIEEDKLHHEASEPHKYSQSWTHGDTWSAWQKAADTSRASALKWEVWARVIREALAEDG